MYYHGIGMRGNISSSQRVFRIGYCEEILDYYHRAQEIAVQEIQIKALPEIEMYNNKEYNKIIDL